MYNNLSKRTKIHITNKVGNERFFKKILLGSGFSKRLSRTTNNN